MGTKLKSKPEKIDLVKKQDLQEKIEQLSSYIDDAKNELLKDEYGSLEINEDSGPSHKAIIAHDLKNDVWALGIKINLFEMYYDMKLEIDEIKKMLAQLLHDRE